MAGVLQRAYEQAVFRERTEEISQRDPPLLAMKTSLRRIKFMNQIP